MEAVPGHTNLVRRGAVYYHRCKVPADIAATYGKGEETFSLRTTELAEAVRREGRVRRDDEGDLAPGLSRS